MNAKTFQFRHTLIRASAGSGKTYRLSSRYLDIVAQSGRPDEILATTFTRKAAGEILDRIMMRLADAAADADKLAELNRSLDGPPQTRETCLETLQLIPQQMHRLQVKTLDSHFIRLAQCFSFELGLPPDWTILDEVDDQRLRLEAIGRVLNHPETDEVIQLLHLLSKGATQRSISQLVIDTVNNLYGIFLDSQEEAWQVLKLASAPHEREVENAVLFLSSYEFDTKRPGTTRDQDIARFQSGQWENFLKTGLAVKVVTGDETFYNKPIPSEVCQAYEILIRHATSILLGRYVEQNRGAYQLLQQFHQQYERLKWQRRGYRFEDITRRLSETLATNPEIQNQFRLDRKIEHLLLDEFQDTSPVQWEVLRPVAQKIAAQPQGRSILCVGDMKQAIYAWRGGVAEIFDAVETTLPGIECEPMDCSYRSSPVVIDTVNKVFSRLSDFPTAGKLAGGIQHWLRFFNEHKTAKSKLPGHVTLETAPFDLEGKPNAECVLARTADRVAELVAQAPHVSIGVLVRANKTVASMIYLLRARGVMASEEGGNPLTDSAAVQLVLSLLEWIDHPGNTAAKWHVAQSPLGSVLGAARKSAAGWESCANQLRRQLLVDGYGPTIGRWAQLLQPHCNPREERRLEQLERLAFAYQGKVTLRTRDFVRFIEAQRVADASSAAVRVMNIHQSKGLEFDAVFLPELDGNLSSQPDSFVVRREQQIGPIRGVTHHISEKLQPLLPQAIQEMFAESQQKDVVESLCVLYVALTRAVHSLHMVIQPRSAPKGGADGPRRSFSGILLHGLTTTHCPEENQLLYENGDPHWFVAIEKQAAETESQDTSETRLPIALRSPAANQAAGFVAPSSLEGGRTRRVADLFRAETNPLGMQYGSAMHAWFEEIDWLETFEPNQKAMITAARSQFGATFRYETVFKQFEQILKSDPARDLLARQRYVAQKWWKSSGDPELVVQREFPFAITHEGTILRGSIDRLVLIKQGNQVVAADVIDFKTDQFADEAALRDKVRFYQPQIRSYCAAVAKMFHLPPASVRGTFFFVHGPQLIPVPENDAS